MIQVKRGSLQLTQSRHLTLNLRNRHALVLPLLLLTTPQTHRILAPKLYSTPDGSIKTSDVAQSTSPPEASSPSSTSDPPASSMRHTEKKITPASSAARSTRTSRSAQSDARYSSSVSSPAATSFAIPLIVAASAFAALVFMYRKFFSEQAKNVFDGISLKIDGVSQFMIGKGCFLYLSPPHVP